MDDFHLTIEEVKASYFKPDGLNKSDPHKAGLIKIAEDQTIKILAWLKDNGEPIFDDWVTDAVYKFRVRLGNFYLGNTL